LTFFHLWTMPLKPPLRKRCVPAVGHGRSLIHQILEKRNLQEGNLFSAAELLKQERVAKEGPVTQAVVATNTNKKRRHMDAFKMYGEKSAD